LLVALAADPETQRRPQTGRSHTQTENTSRNSEEEHESSRTNHRQSEWGNGRRPC
jgi:hypothetical protein